jgi:hypothetical protein
MILQEFDGTWAGTNGFRLMPSDPFAELPARLTLSHGAGGHLASVAYWWQHPDDGLQDGLLVVGPGTDAGSVVAMWGDSWHQKPAPMLISGTNTPETTLEFEADYGGGWRWRIILDAIDKANFRLQMDNVIPDSHATADKPAGPYPVMVLNAQRAD